MAMDVWITGWRGGRMGGGEHRWGRTRRQGEGRVFSRFVFRWEAVPELRQPRVAATTTPEAGHSISSLVLFLGTMTSVCNLFCRRKCHSMVVVHSHSFLRSVCCMTPLNDCWCWQLSIWWLEFLQTRLWNL